MRGGQSPPLVLENCKSARFEVHDEGVDPFVINVHPPGRLVLSVHTDLLFDQNPAAVPVRPCLQVDVYTKGGLYSAVSRPDMGSWCPPVLSIAGIAAIARCEC